MIQTCANPRCTKRVFGSGYCSVDCELADLLDQKKRSSYVAGRIERYGINRPCEVTDQEIDAVCDRMDSFLRTGREIANLPTTPQGGNEPCVTEERREATAPTVATARSGS